MNYADKANQLRAEREQREKQTKAEADRRVADQAHREQQDRQDGDKKTEALLPLFQQFDGHEIPSQGIKLKAIKQNDANNELTVMLKVDSAGTRGLHLLGRPVVSARCFRSKFCLSRFFNDGKPGPGYLSEHDSQEKLMEAVAQAVSEL